MIREQIYTKVAGLYPAVDSAGNVSENGGEALAESITNDILALIEKWRGKAPQYPQWVDQTTSYLITYGDSFSRQGEPTLQTMKCFADKYLKEAISNIHILPMFPYTSDDGFSVVDYRKVDENLGDWAELNALAENFDLMYDCVINHISKSSDWFQGFLAGDEAYQDYFVVSDPELDYSSVTRPRALPLLTPFTKANGETAHVWTTFSDDQIDINFHSPKVLLESIDILLMYAANGGRSIRLDAIGFIWKVLNTSCIHLPEAHEIIKLWRIVMDEVMPGSLLITETNVPHPENVAYFGQGDEAHMVYQFPLPPLTLHAFLGQDSQVLTKWAKGLTEEAMASLEEGRKTTYFNFLASHDGIGVRPTEGILTNDDRQMMCEQVERKGGRVNYKNNGDGTQSPYELNINYLSAITEPDDDAETKANKFLAAQSILLSFVGVPAVYYHSLLGSENDVQGMVESGINRRINREKFALEDLEAELAQVGSLRNRIYTEMVRLLDLRKQQSAFAPTSKQVVLELSSQLFGLQRGEGDEAIRFVVNLSATTQAVSLTAGGRDLVSGEAFDAQFTLNPYQFVWLAN
ncbi:alpha-amylase family glycosyl hydrolase [Vibrio renipiscarius]|uniref:alpha-amylase family glycosyl hydrolase n=1 Tax=Vibrio renipiscarius TaxID=1461322 RepID=UPI00355471E7